MACSRAWYGLLKVNYRGCSREWYMCSDCDVLEAVYVLWLWCARGSICALIVMCSRQYMCSDCDVLEAVYVLWLWCARGCDMGARVWYMCSDCDVCARVWHGLLKVSYRLVTQGSGIGCLRQWYVVKGVTWVQGCGICALIVVCAQGCICALIGDMGCSK
jgi:hypothetical protein